MNKMKVNLNVVIEVDPDEWEDEFLIDRDEVPERVRSTFHYFVVRECYGTLMQKVNVTLQ